MSAREEIARTCVGCRQKDDRDALLRFVAFGEPPQVVPDVARRASGRGASVHPRRRCIEAAVKSGALRRALRADLKTDTNELATWALGQYGRKLDALLAAAHRAGHATYGQDRVRQAIEERRVALLVVAGDAQENRQDLMRAAERLGAACLVHGDKAILGRLFGRETVAVAAVTDRALANELQIAARCAAEISEGAC
jgi:predicted RNA-binding protein YlxR (DUF448 family)/ribosomal protein L7Ae-like RNA K-turn-binding protein